MAQKETADKKMNGAEALIAILEANGCECIFGYPGGANLPIYDALRSSKIRHILARHEQGAVHMADGYARVKNTPGVCLATSGPGATNLVTGLANAMLDSIPMVAITAQIPRELIGTDAFQEVDCINITMPVTKHNELVAHEKDLVHALKAAFHIANSGRKGPVLLDIPQDVLEAVYPHDLEQKLDLPGYQPTTQGNVGQIKRAIKLLNKAEKPLVLFGGGIITSRAEQELKQFLSLTQIPAVRTLMGTGILGEEDPLYMGLVGTHGNSIANRLIQREADVLFVIGARLGNRATIKPDLFAKNAKLIHLDIDPAEIGKNIACDLPIVGDLKTVLQDINHRIETKPFAKPKQWTQRIEKHKSTLTRKDFAPILEVIFSELSKIERKLNISTDVGRHQMWANHHCTNPMHLPLITSGGLGTMGFGLPAAIGAWFAEPETPVISLSGDGSFMMTMQEFIVAVENEVPLTVLLLNDYRLGMIRELQTSQYGQRFISHQFGHHVDFPQLAQAMGGEGYKVSQIKNIGPTIKKSIESGKPGLINFDLEKIHKSSYLHSEDAKAS